MYMFNGLIECLPGFEFRRDPLRTLFWRRHYLVLTGHHFDVANALQSAPRTWKAATHAKDAAYQLFCWFPRDEHIVRDIFTAALDANKCVSEVRLRERHQETDLRDPCQSSKEPRLSTPCYPGSPDCLTDPPSGTCHFVYLRSSQSQIVQQFHRQYILELTI